MKKILIVDDNWDLLNVLSRHLKNSGYQVSVTDSGIAVPDMMRRDMPDLVLLDLNLPDQSGLVTLERILRLNPEVPVVMMTGEGDIATAVQAMKLGARDFLSKPFDNTKDTIHDSFAIGR